MAEQTTTVVEQTQDNGTVTEQTQDNGTVTEQTQDKTFTQAELDDIVEGRLAKERKKMPSADELEKYREWKKEQQTEAEKQAEIIKERDNANAQLLFAQRKAALYEVGYGKNDDFEYLLYKLNNIEGDETEKIKSLSALVPPKQAETIKADTSFVLGGNGKAELPATNQTMNNLIRGGKK